MKKCPLKSWIIAGTFVVLSVASASAQPHERYRTKHWVFDNRFHHDHYYPRIGYRVGVLPAGYVVVKYRTGPFYYSAGVWYRPTGPGFVVVAPPLGIVVPILPPAYATIYAGGVPYYYANEVYYQQVPDGYTVVNAPANYTEAPPAPAAQAPQPPGSAPQAGVWYYCDSAKAYYPYVSACKEGWRQVPAVPPPTH